MIFETKNNKQCLLRRLNSDDFENLSAYLQSLSAETTKRFAPHRFDIYSIIDLYEDLDACRGYIAIDIETGKIVAYSIVKRGYLEHDKPRLQSYGLTLDTLTDSTFAPSVADHWQSSGIGDRMLRYILSDLKTAGIKRVILWGGVQADNDKAVNYYLKNGFKTLGRFTYNGENYDMILEIV